MQQKMKRFRIEKLVELWDKEDSKEFFVILVRKSFLGFYYWRPQLRSSVSYRYDTYEEAFHFLCTYYKYSILEL